MAYVIVCLWLFSVKEGQISLTICPSKIFYHIPCPGCGVTRATTLLFDGEVLKALRMNPNCIFATIFIIAYPVVLILGFIKRCSYIADSYLFLDKILHYKPCLYSLLIVELLIWIHNIIIGI